MFIVHRRAALRTQILFRVMRDVSSDRYRNMPNNAGTPLPDNYHTTLSNRELLQAQDRMMAHQDEQLCELEGTVSNLNNMSVAISEEIALHNDLLDGLNDQASLTQDSLAHNRGRLSEVLTRHNNCCLWCVIILFIVMMVLLLTVAQ